MLWIRSQNKTTLAQVTSLEIVAFDDDEYVRIFCYNNNHNVNIMMGEYTTQRAFEIIDEIQKLLSPIYIKTADFDNNVLDLSKNENIKLLVKSSGDMYIQQLNDIIYEMPGE